MCSIVLYRMKILYEILFSGPELYHLFNLVVDALVIKVEFSL